MEFNSALWILAWVMIIGGLFGTFLPLLPGIWMMFAGMLLIAWQGNFQHIGYGTLGILLTLTIIAHVVDYIAGAMGAKKFGASRYAIIGAFIGAIVGLFMGIIGVIIGPFIGAVMGELMASKGLDEATKAGIGTWLGLLVGMVLKIVIAFMMLGIFLIIYYFTPSSPIVVTTMI